MFGDNMLSLERAWGYLCAFHGPDYPGLPSGIDDEEYATETAGSDQLDLLTAG
jgi:hypothetical protein